MGIGTLIGDRDYSAQKKKSWFVFAQNRFMFFDRNKIHIQAFVDFINGKLMSGHSSSSTFHDFKILSFLIINETGILNFKNSKTGHIRFPKFRFLSFIFPLQYFP